MTEHDKKFQDYFAEEREKEKQEGEEIRRKNVAGLLKGFGEYGMSNESAKIYDAFRSKLLDYGGRAMLHRFPEIEGLLRQLYITGNSDGYARGSKNS